MKYLLPFYKFSTLESFDLDDEDEEEDDVYTEMNEYLQNLRKSKDKWGTFNLLVGQDKTPMTFIIDDICAHAHDRYLYVPFIKENLLTEFNAITYETYDDLYEILDTDYTIFLEFISDNVHIDGCYKEMEFASEDDKNKFEFFVSKIESAMKLDKEYIQASVKNYLQTEGFDLDDEDEEEDTYGRRFSDRHYFTRIENNDMPKIRNRQKARSYIKYIKQFPNGIGITNLVTGGRKVKSWAKPTTDSYASMITWLKLNDYIDLIRTDNQRTIVKPTEKTLNLTEEEINNI